jgi:hypothetical protein
MSRPTPDDYAEARRLLASVLDAPPADRCHHDHDEELRCLSFNDPPLSSKPRSLAYWLETGSLVRGYLVLQAGAGYNDTLRQGFVDWLKRLPGGRRRYMEGDDMARASLVDQYLKPVR